jgi:hypothetical protein
MNFTFDVGGFNKVLLFVFVILYALTLKLTRPETTCWQDEENYFKIFFHTVKHCTLIRVFSLISLCNIANVT